MKVLVIASRKGGSGKTTLAGHLAVQAELTGYGQVALADTDSQGSLADWWNRREAPTPVFAQTTIADLPADVERLRGMGMKLLVIDTPPALSETIANVVEVSDLVVIPTRPSPHDLRSIGATVELVEHLGKPLVFVLNSAPQRARITAEAVSVLSRHGMLAPITVHQRVGFAASMIDGRTVMELPGEVRACEEITQLWGYLRNRLEGSTPRRALPTPVVQLASDAVLTAARAGRR